MKNESVKKIFCFWEPENNIPPYLKLCMKTWKKFLPEYEIIMLNYENIFDYVDKNFYSQKLFSGSFSLAHIADALRAKILEKNGGIWLDLDTVILSRECLKFLNSNKEVSFFGNNENRGVNIGFIRCNKNSNLMKYWSEKAQEKIFSFDENKKDSSFWAYLGNSIIHQYVIKDKENIEIYDNSEIFPEKKYINSKNTNHKNAYVDYYFQSKLTVKDLDKSCSMILLHNSWTPSNYREMAEQEFINTDCTLSNILSELLNIKKEVNKQFDDNGNVFKLVNQDGSVIYNPKIMGLNIKFVGSNGLIELHAPIGTWECSNIICGTNSKIIIDGTQQKHFRHSLNINAKAENNLVKIGRDFGCWGVSIALQDESNLEVHIGEDVIMDSNIIIRPSDAHTIYDMNTKVPLNIGQNIYIGNHVWIGSNVNIFSGCTIASNNVIGCNSFIDNNFFESYSLIRGIPAQIVKKNINWDRRNATQYSKEFFIK